jgi:hypothetical protein
VAKLRKKRPDFSTTQVGFWLQSRQPKVFNKMHAALSTAKDSAKVDLVKLMR